MKDFFCTSRKRVSICVLLMLVSFFACFRLGFWQNGLALSALFFLLIPSKIQFDDNKEALLGLIWLVLSSIVAFVISQLAADTSIKAVGVRILFNILLICALYSFLLALTGRIKLATILGTGLLVAFATADYYVLRFRGREIAPYDFASVATAAIVAREYNYLPGITLVLSWIQFFLFVLVSRSFPAIRLKSVSSKVSAVLISVVLVLGVLFGSRACVPHTFGNSGAGINGLLLNFSLQFRNLRVEKPESYSLNAISELEKKYEIIPDETTTTARMPDVIVIMNESFADLSVLGSDLQTNISVMPFYQSLSDNTVKGYALSSVYGGNTANSEYEFLTGNSMIFLPENAIPYQQYIHSDQYTLASYLSMLGYKTVGMHPYNANGWMRNTVYPLLGFEECVFVDDFPQKHYIRSYISDEEMYNEILNRYLMPNDNDKNLFIFGVTVQNHGGFDYSGPDFSSVVQLEGYKGDYPDVEQYLSLIRESDRALESFISALEQYDRDVIVVFFGDHLPNLNMSFYEEVHGGSFDTLEDQMLLHTVPFFLWANFDIQETRVELASLNYLRSYLYEAAGLPIPGYDLFLRDAQAVVPAINADGFLSMKENRFLTLDEAQGEEERILESYHNLVYNSLFDQTNHSILFSQFIDAK